jgi:hypothetical protein
MKSLLSFPGVLHSLLSWSTEFQVAFLAAVVQGRLPTQLGQAAFSVSAYFTQALQKSGFGFFIVAL